MKPKWIRKIPDETHTCLHLGVHFGDTVYIEVGGERVAVSLGGIPEQMRFIVEAPRRSQVTRGRLVDADRPYEPGPTRHALRRAIPPLHGYVGKGAGTR